MSLLNVIKKKFYFYGLYKPSQKYSQCLGVYDNFGQIKKNGQDRFDSYCSDACLKSFTSEAIAAQITFRDFPNLFFLQSALKNITNVLDFGGACGHHYFAYRKHLDLSNIQWHVVEMNEIVSKGNEISANENSIFFHTDVNHVNQFDLFFCSGAIHYVEDYDRILKYAKKARYILFSRLPLGKKTIVTTQNIGITKRNIIPLYIFNRNDFVNMFLDEFDLVGEVQVPWDGLFIPYHDEETVRSSSVLFFKKKI